MKCNLECPFAKYNGRNHDGTQNIICTSENWFRDSSDDCIKGYTEKQMELLKRKYLSHPKERYRVFTEGETGDNVIVDLDEIPTDSNVVSLTLEDTCQRLNEQDQRIEELEKELEKEPLDDITMHERYRDNLLMDPTKCIHLKEFNKVISKDGRELSLYKCEKGHSLCQKSMFDPICEDYELLIKSIRK